MKRYFISIVAIILMLTSGALVGCGQPPYFKAPGERVHLVNNSRAFDHTWQEVWAFLARDTTDEEAYTPDRTSGYFAEMLHNRAEYYGFKTAFVIVEFETGESHALNAFNTIDYGLVYVDCTGKGDFEVPASLVYVYLIGTEPLAPVSSWDKVAYIEEGEKMGFISLGYTEQNFSYEWYKKWYEKWRERLRNFEKDLDSYNKDLASWDAKVALVSPWIAGTSDTYPPKTLEELTAEKIRREHGAEMREQWERLRQEWERLGQEQNRLRTEWTEVRGYNWKESESPVKSIKVYW